MSFRHWILVACWVGCSLPGLVHSQKSTPPTQAAPTYETLRAQLKHVAAEWAKHRRQEIAVLDIVGFNQVGGAKDEEKQLMLRLETLQNKGISNREWTTYWQTESDLSIKMDQLYEKLAPKSGISPLVAEQKAKQRLADVSGIKERSKQDAFIKAETERSAAEQAVRVIMNGFAESIRGNSGTVDRLKQLRDQQTQAVANINSQLAAMSQTEGRSTVEAELETAQLGLTEITDQYETALQKTKTLEAQQQAISEILAGTSLDMDGLDAEKKSVLTRYTAAKKQFDAAKQERDSAQQIAAKLLAESNQAKIDIKRFRDRRPALLQWANLAQRKVKNQAIYYDAIQADMNAVNKRLRGLEKIATKTDETNIRQACQPSLTAKETPFTRHRTCIQAMQRDIEDLTIEREQVRQKEKLTVQLSASVAQLIAAQITDEELVNEETKIAQRERDRSRASGAELDVWRSVWAVSYDRAVAKQKQLSAAVLSSKQSERTLKAKLGVYRDTLKRIGDTLLAAQNALDEKASFGNTVGSVVETAWQIIRVGWPALIYLFVAFLILRFIRRYRDRSEQKALDAQDGDGNEELDELGRLLAQAEEANDEDRELELHEEIGKLENRIKDEGQRIATIARVASQALSLIVYIATFLLVLDALTVDIKPILGGAAIFGLAISFGSQSLVKDVVSGFFILLENQYAVGDVVSINGNSGTVEKVTLRRTVLRDGKGAVHNITNGSVSSVTNSTQGWARVIVHVGVAYGSDLEAVENVVNQVGEEMYDDPKWSGKLTEKPSYVGVTALGASEVQVRVMFKTKTFQNWGAEREFNRRILGAFEKAGIDIPFPTQKLLVSNDKHIAE